ncbi:hypothetical protein CEXT_673441 [Caerostris extrusa]|uniref:Reverse transcriptase n=1 Tax=Caerostris extrusa TaxID=172846 RepID=A0AAV4V3X6_CAEEX|nr:hypothetical protein CEXT_673441 [Caerostris extrusa]
MYRKSRHVILWKEDISSAFTEISRDAVPGVILDRQSSPRFRESITPWGWCHMGWKTIDLTTPVAFTKLFNQVSWIKKIVTDLPKS